MHTASESTSPTSSTRLQERLQRARRFFSHDLWRIEHTTFSSPIRFVIFPLQVMVIVLRGFFVEHQCMLRANALTYTTMLLLVPMLAFMFAFLKGFGIQEHIGTWVIGQISPGSEDIVRQIIALIDNVKVGTLSVISLGSMLLLTLLQLGKIEQSFNAIWGVRTDRTVVRKLSDYVSVIVLTPIMLAVALSAGLREWPFIAVLFKYQIINIAVAAISPFVFSVALWVTFTFVYAFMPNTRVRLLPALIGGLFASTLWQLAKWGYIASQVGLAQYNAIYGVFAQLPVFMIWLQVSWLITLLGAEVTFACQNATMYQAERFTSSTSVYAREWLACALYCSLVRAFTNGAGPWSAETFAQEYYVPVRVMRDTLGSLVDEGLLVETAAPPDHYVPGRDPATLTPWQLLSAIRHHGGTDLEALIEQQDSPATALMQQIDTASQHAIGTHTIPQWLSAHSSFTPAVDAQR